MTIISPRLASPQLIERNLTASSHHNFIERERGRKGERKGGRKLEIKRERKGKERQGDTWGRKREGRKREGEWV